MASKLHENPSEGLIQPHEAAMREVLNSQHLPTATSFLPLKSILTEKNIVPFSKTEFSLSYVQFTGEIKYHTPSLVIQEIAECHGIICEYKKLKNDLYRLAIINEINHGQTESVNLLDMQSNDYRHLARFINPRCNWTTKSLKLAIERIEPFLNKRFELLTSDFHAGKLTPSSIDKIPIIILYGVCCHYQLSMNINDDIHVLARKVRLYLNYNVSELQKYIANNIHMVSSRSTLVNILYQVNGKIDREIVSQVSLNFEQLNQAGIKIFSRRFDATPFIPKTRNDAIAFAALTYQIDISGAKDVNSELQALKLKHYDPIDESLIRRYQSKYPWIDSPNLKMVFNPKLPRSCYPIKTLTSLANYEGYRPSDLDPYGFLQQAYISETFHHGKLPNIDNYDNVLGDIIDELSTDEIVCYGIRHQKMYAYTYYELLVTFSQYSIYQNPRSLENNIFLTLAVNKLLSLAKQPQYSTESLEHYRIRIKLAKKINHIDILINQLSPINKDLLSLYHGNDTNQNIIKTLLYQLRDIAFYMRGWSGDGPYPVVKVPEKDYEKVEKLTLDAMVKFEYHCIENGEIGRLILNLPLLNYSVGKFYPMSNEQGSTIGERLDIIKHGNKYHNDTPCIRTSSNFLVASSYRYLAIFELDPGFKIEHLSIIQ